MSKNTPKPDRARASKDAKLKGAVTFNRITGKQKKVEYKAKAEGVDALMELEKTRLKTNRDIEVAKANRSKYRSQAAAATGVAANTDVAIDADVVSGGIAPRNPGANGQGTNPTQPSNETRPSGDKIYTKEDI